MPYAEDFLSSLEDYELAFLRKYKLKSYLKPTQEKIREEIRKRRLLDRELDRMVESREHNPNNTGCPRCDSKKMRRDQIDIAKGAGGSGSKIAFAAAAASTGYDLTSKGEKVICQVCGYILQDDDSDQSILSQ